MLRPLEQFICDTCGEIIESKEQGWIEWLTDGGKYRSFRIVHHWEASPKKNGDRCYTHGSTRGEQTAHLNEFASDGVAGRLLNFLSVEPHTEREGAEPYIHSLQEWVEISRRLLLPYYEEGRLYIAKGKVDDFLSDPNNPAYIYSPSVLKRLVEKYSDR